MKIGKFGLAISLPALMAAASLPAQAADIVYPIEDPVYAPVPMALLGDLKLGLGFSSHHESYSDDDDDDWTLIDVLGEGRVNMPVHGGSMQLQLDIGAYGSIYEGYGMGAASFQGHLWHKRDNLAYGLLGGLALSEGPAMWSIGAEAEHYYGNTTLGAYATYNFGSFEHGELSVFHVAGYVEHYVTPDHKVGLEVDYASFSGEGDGSAWGVVLSGEKRVSGTPFSYWAEAGYSDWSGGPYESNAWGAMAGVRIALGGTPGMTLQEHDRYLPWENNGSLSVLSGIDR